VSVGFFKPVAQPGEGGSTPERSTALVRLVTNLEPPDPLGAAHVEALLGAGQLDDLMEEVVGLGEQVRVDHDVVVVEGLVPSSALVYSGQVNLALAKALDADVLLVGAPRGRRPGRAGRDDGHRRGDVPLGRGRPAWSAASSTAAGRRAQRVDAVRSALATHGLALVGAVPTSPELTWPRVLDLARALDARALNEGEWETRRVKDVAICAQSVPGVLAVLEEGRLIVTPGDRHDVIMAACLAALNGTRLAALLLTVGIEPDPAVWRLTRARARPACRSS
jgi:phosphate acetyltransferase